MAVVLAWWLPGGLWPWLALMAVAWTVARGVNFDIVAGLVAWAQARRMIAAVVRDIDAHNASVLRARTVARLREAGAEVDADLLRRTASALCAARGRLMTALRVDRVLREDGRAVGGALILGSSAAETLARDAADREAWLERAIEEAEATLHARRELAIEDRERERLRT